jgi:sn-glycerol 3-phosphate transport system permease protein
MRRARSIDWLPHAVLLFGIAIIAFPVYVTVVASTLTTPDIVYGPMSLLPGPHGPANYWQALSEGNAKTSGVGVDRMLLNSLVVALSIAVGKIAISILSAYAVVFFSFPGRMVFFWLIFLTLMLPIEVRIVPTFEAVANAALPLQWLADALHVADLWKWISGHDVTIALEWNMVNTYPGLILPLIASATATFLFRQFFLTVPDELCEAARLDGASPLRFFWSILLPLSVSNIVALAIILFLFGWNQYLWPLLFTTDKDMATAVIALKNLIPRADSEPAWNIAMSGALLTMLPPTLVILLLQRWFLKGLIDSSK